MDEGECRTEAALAAASGAASVTGGSIPAPSRAIAKQARPISRSPPRDARPALEASARKRNVGVASAKGGSCPIKFAQLVRSTQCSHYAVRSAVSTQYAVP